MNILYQAWNSIVHLIKQFYCLGAFHIAFAEQTAKFITDVILLLKICCWFDAKNGLPLEVLD